MPVQFRPAERIIAADSGAHLQLAACSLQSCILHQLWPGAIGSAVHCTCMCIPRCAVHVTWHLDASAFGCELTPNHRRQRHLRIALLSARSRPHAAAQACRRAAVTVPLPLPPQPTAHSLAPSRPRGAKARFLGGPFAGIGSFVKRKVASRPEDPGTVQMVVEDEETEFFKVHKIVGDGSCMFRATVRLPCCHSLLPLPAAMRMPPLQMAALWAL